MNGIFTSAALYGGRSQQPINQWLSDSVQSQCRVYLSSLDHKIPPVERDSVTVLRPTLTEDLSL